MDKNNSWRQGYVHTYIYIYIHTYTSTYSGDHIYTCTYMQRRTYTYTYTYTRIYIYIYTYIRVRVHIYIYIYMARQPTTRKPRVCGSSRRTSPCQRSSKGTPRVWRCQHGDNGKNQANLVPRLELA